VSGTTSEPEHHHPIWANQQAEAPHWQPERSVQGDAYSRGAAIPRVSQAGMEAKTGWNLRAQ